MIVKSNPLMFFPAFAMIPVGKSLLAEEGPVTPWWLWLFAIIVFILLAIIFPWLMSRQTKKAAQSSTWQPKPEEKMIKTVSPSVDVAPRAPAAAVVPEPATPVKPDDLTVLEGIGPKIASVLQAAGIQTYKKLSETGLEALKDILLKGGIKLADPSTWAEQAKLLAEGKMDDFKTLTDQLKGGRRV
jgi:predicted flap endonuclease-1-like 5' DNA nuclease